MAYTNFQNCTKQQYETILYSGGSTNRLKIWFNEVELQNADNYCEKITKVSRILPNDGSKRFSLDNFISIELTIVFHDINPNLIQDKVRISIGTLVDKANNIYEYVPLGIFNIQNTPTTDKDKITLKLRDNACLFDFNYSAKDVIELNGGTATKMQILQDICTQANVVCGVTQFNGMNDLIGVYDNSVTARVYVSYLAEQSGLSAIIDRDGILRFVDFISREDTQEINNSTTLEKVTSTIPLDLQLNGNTSQNGTPSPSSPVDIQVVTGRQVFETCKKNLFNANNTISNVFYDTSDGHIISSNVWSQSNFIGVNGEEKISISSGYSTINNSYELSQFDSNNQWITGVQFSLDTSKTYTLNANTKYIRLGFRNDRANVDIQVEKGSSSTTYEPYDGNSYEINLGKNLWNNELIQSGAIRLNVNSFRVTPNTTYTFSATLTNGQAYFYYQDINKNNISTYGWRNIPDTFTTPSNCYYIAMRIRKSDDSNIVPTDVSNIQLEKGSQATTYSAYKEPIELCKIGDYKDKIYKSNGKWYLYKETTKKTLDGVNNKFNNRNSTNSSGKYRFSSNAINGVVCNTTNGAMAYSNKMSLDVSAGTYTYLSGKNSFTIGQSDIVCQIDDILTMSVNNANTWLESNNIEVYYPLATPTTTEITDTELINQLNAIELLLGLNNIIVSSNDLSSPLKLTYYKEREALRIPLSIVEKYEIGTPYTIQRVVYEDAIRKYQSSNNDTLSTLYLNTANPYISSQNQIDYIYNQLNGFTLDSFTTGRILGNPAIDPYDIIEIYNDYELSEPIIARTLANHTFTYRGTMLNEYDTKIGKEERKENVTIKSPESIKKTVGTEIDNINGLVRMWGEVIDNQNEAIQKAELQLDGYGLRLDKATQYINPDTGEIEKVKVKNYSLDENGFAINNPDTGYKSLSTETGTSYYDNDIVKAQFTKDNAIIKDIVLYGTYYYGVDKDLDVAQFTKDDAMFVAEKYIDENNEECFGHFWNGSD